jgi:hypothetical protein
VTGARVVRLLAAVAVVAVLVWGAASLLVRPAERGAVAFGVGAAAVWQALVLAVTATALPQSRLAAFGVGMIARFLLVAAAALVIVPALGLPMGPALLPMVTVLFATTLIEPVLFAPGAGDTRVR